MDMTMSSAMPSRVEVVTSVQRRRRWTSEQKLEIVKQTNEPGSSFSLVAQQFGRHKWQSGEQIGEQISFVNNETHQPCGSQGIVQVTPAHMPIKKPPRVTSWRHFYWHWG